LVAEVGSLARM
jgi:hypothetical protein